MKYVIYHDNNCYDGFTAAWLFYLAYGNDPNEIIFLPCNYDEPFPIDMNQDHSKDECYIADFSFKRDIILKHKDKFKKFLIIDHHKTAKADLEGLDCAIFDMDRSGAKLVFDYLYQDIKKATQHPTHTEARVESILKKIEYFVNRVSDRDLFQFKLEYTSEYYFYMSAFPMTFENWDKICFTPIQEIEVAGKLIQQHERTYIEKRIKEMFFVTLYDPYMHRLYTVPETDEYLTFLLPRKIPCVNVTPEYGTNTCKAILNMYPEYNYACYFWYGDGKKVWGIRSRDEYDCSKIASYYGGGGHKNAAGWVEKI